MLAYCGQRGCRVASSGTASAVQAIVHFECFFALAKVAMHLNLRD
jgi:hypothetical protein